MTHIKEDFSFSAKTREALDVSATDALRRLYIYHAELLADLKYEVKSHRAEDPGSCEDAVDFLKMRPSTDARDKALDRARFKNNQGSLAIDAFAALSGHPKNPTSLLSTASKYSLIRDAIKIFKMAPYEISPSSLNLSPQAFMKRLSRRIFSKEDRVEYAERRKHHMDEARLFGNSPLK